MNRIYTQTFNFSLAVIAAAVLSSQALAGEVSEDLQQVLESLPGHVRINLRGRPSCRAVIARAQ